MAHKSNCFRVYEGAPPTYQVLLPKEYWTTLNHSTSFANNKTTCSRSTIRSNINSSSSNCKHSGWYFARKTFGKCKNKCKTSLNCTFLLQKHNFISHRLGKLNQNEIDFSYTFFSEHNSTIGSQQLSWAILCVLNILNSHYIRLVIKIYTFENIYE